ncbi:hypothetical protein H9X96_12040 [Pedobacter sp. N36a]|uniref:DUF6520 family protein n=1 Tax=Pedobacter sp. N36a TaxID=2767996 RepID=UPI001656F53F|nr:DUF6520 family protein [Pedobacter sp. N36a]MBC8986510.1 hypothetical protein [Pedobacter sp. N36a]
MKKVFFALFAVVIAVGGSAFTNAKELVDRPVYGGSSLTQYDQITIPYTNVDCENTSDKTCAFQVTEAGESIVTELSYTDAQMARFLLDGKVEVAPGSSKGLYNP